MTPANAEPTPRHLLSSLRSAVQTFQALRNDTPINMVVLFLLIAERGRGVGAAELVKLAGLSHASVSRNVQALGRGKEAQPGLGLVTKSIDPVNPRAHIIRLTSKGIALAQEMTCDVRGSLEQAALPHAFGTEPSDRFREMHWSIWAE